MKKRDPLLRFLIVSLLLHLAVLLGWKFEAIADAVKELPVVRELVPKQPEQPELTPEELLEQEQAQQEEARQRLEEELKEEFAHELKQEEKQQQLEEIAESRTLLEALAQTREELTERLWEETHDALKEDIQKLAEEQVQQQETPKRVEESLVAKKDALKAQMREALTRNLEELAREEDVRKTAEEQLKREMEEIVADKLPELLKEEMWENLRRELEEELEAFAKRNRDVERSDARRQADMQSLQEQLKAAMHRVTEAMIVEKAVEALEQKVVPEIRKAIEAQIEARPGKSLEQMAQQMLRQEEQQDAVAKRDVNAALQRAMQETTRAQQQIEAAEEAARKAFEQQQEAAARKQQAEELLAQAEAQLQQAQEQQAEAEGQSKEAQELQAEARQQVQQAKAEITQAERQEQQAKPLQTQAQNQLKAAEKHLQQSEQQRAVAVEKAQRFEAVHELLAQEGKSASDTAQERIERAAETVASEEIQPDYAERLVEAKAAMEALSEQLQAVAAAMGQEDLQSESLARAEQMLAQMSEEEFQEEMAAAFEQDFTERGHQVQVDRVAQVFHQEAHRKGLRDQSLRDRFRERASETLAKLSEEVRAGETGLVPLGKILESRAVDLGESPEESVADKEHRQETADKAQPLIERAMQNVSAAHTRESQGALSEALQEAFGSEAVSALQETAVHMQVAMRLQGLSAAEAEPESLTSDAGGTDRTTGDGGPQIGDGRYEEVEELDARDDIVALALDTEYVPEEEILQPLEGRDGGVPAGIWLMPEGIRESGDSAETVERAYEPPFKTSVFATAPRVNKEDITLDGDLSEWSDWPLVSTRDAVDGRPGFRMAWCPEGIFLAIEAHDPEGVITRAGPGSHWYGDMLEIWFDFPNLKRGGRLAEDDGTHQFGVYPFGGNPRELYGFEFGPMVNGHVSWGKNLSDEDISVSGQMTDYGWAVEIFFPISRLSPKATLELGRFIGFDVAVFNGHGGRYWSGGYSASFSHPSRWGDVLLAGSDAKVELRPVVSRTDDEDAWKTEGALLWPGDTIDIRVTDPDRSVNPERTDSVRVTVQTDGDSEEVILQETAPDSGVFRGQLPTVLAIGENTPGVLDCYEGSTVRVVYIDRMRHDGPRNREVTAKGTIALGVMARGR